MDSAVGSAVDSAVDSTMAGQDGGRLLALLVVLRGKVAALDAMLAEEMACDADRVILATVLKALAREIDAISVEMAIPAASASLQPELRGDRQ